MRSVGDEPACCGHARRLGERPIFGDPWPFGPASTGPGQTPPLGRASPQGSLSGGSSRVDAKIRSASSLNLFPTIKKKKKKKKKVPRSFDLWSFPSLMGFRRLSFPTDFIFLFPNHICLPALSKPYQRREISSWLTQPSQWWHRRHPSDWSWLPGKPTGGVYVAEARISPSVMAPTSSSVLAFLHSSSRPKRHAQWPYVPARPLSGPLTVTVPTRVSRYRKQK